MNNCDHLKLDPRTGMCNDYFSPEQIYKQMSKNSAKRDLLMVHFNTRSLPKNKDLIEEFILDIKHRPDIIGISETKLNANNALNVELPHYKFFHHDSPTKAGGVGLYVKENFDCKLRNDLMFTIPDCENIWTEINTTNQGKIILGVIYRHPSSDIQIFGKSLCDVLEKLENLKINYVVCGDMNVNKLSQNNSKIIDYFNSLDAIGCKSLISVPTRFSENSKPSLLDHFYTNITKKTTVGKPCLYEISDHLPICMILKNCAHVQSNQFTVKRDTKNFNLENFLIDLKNQLQAIQLNKSTHNVNKDAEDLTQVFINTLNIHAPLRKMSRSEKRLNKKPWITKGILKSIKFKNNLYKKCFKCDNPDQRKFYKKFSNKLTHIKNLAKRQYFNNLLQENKNNSQKTWSIINELINSKKSCNTKLPPFLKYNGTNLKTDSESFLNQMCDYFANIGSVLANKVPNTSNSEFKIFAKSPVHSFVLNEVTENEVSNSIDNLKFRSSPGIDGVPPKYVKMAKVVLSPILTNLFNKCFRDETFPECFKVSQIIPLPKFAHTQEIGDFRPISLLNVFSKIFEKILKEKIMKFIEKNNILNSSQFGFTTNSSTEYAITTIYDQFLKNLDDNLITCSIFLDIKKAFDSISHDILLKKLYHYGFRGKIWSLLKSYLYGRNSCVKIDQRMSKFYIIKHGVPQGSVLGPILFLIYINDLPHASMFKTTLFADDANLYLSHHNLEILQSKVDKEMKKVVQWMNFNKLTLNYNKSKFIIISRKKQDCSNFCLKINNFDILKTDCIKYLGVLIDDKLSWKNHIENMCSRLSKICGLIFKLRHYVPLTTRKLIYFSMFNSVILYSLINWGRASNSLIHKVEVLQNKFIRASMFCSRDCPTNYLYSKFQTLKLNDMIRMEFAKFMYKYNNHMLPSSFNSYFTKLDQIHRYDTRQKSKGAFFHHAIHTEFGRKNLQHSCLVVWESIPVNQKNCSFTTFKRQFRNSLSVGNNYAFS